MLRGPGDGAGYIERAAIAVGSRRRHLLGRAQGEGRIRWGYGDQEQGLRRQQRGGGNREQDHCHGFSAIARRACNRASEGAGQLHDLPK